ncbi:hypothetical protein HK105_203686 [Polyrhizophydium stewartii]|uniref:Talin N-terminal F0 domain-containing protein n=1 Tax=Polyrhizophydium stewartii TaxID=2732419 RepID=A0ABR4NBP8_9FUNG|nr:SH3 and multiple ankyrin repeat domains protein 2 [Polyrhizophydium stewartii]
MGPRQEGAGASPALGSTSMLNSSGTAGSTIVLRINVPALKLQKALKVNTADTVWGLKKQLIEKFGAEAKDVWNYGIFLHGKEGKQGKFLDERKELSIYGVDTSSQIDFTIKVRLNAETDVKKQKKLFEEVQKGNLDKVQEKSSKTLEPNFWSDGQECPLVAAVMNNDSDMISLLVENGAFLDYRNGDKDGWKTPLHFAAMHNKAQALKTLIGFGAWPNVVDIVGLTPIYYAATSGYSECVLRLLMAKADTEIFDESGKAARELTTIEKHVLTPRWGKAALNNFDCIVAMLIDFGANMHAVNVAGNTSLHVAATRNSKESTKWLLMRGADRERKNKSNKTPLEAAIQANCPDTAEIIQKFTDDQIVPPPPKNIEGDPNAIVSNVLASLAGSIGGEYKPQPFVSSSRTVRNSSQPQTPTSANSHASFLQTQHMSSSPGAQRKTLPSFGDLDMISEGRRSVRKSGSVLPPPPRQRLSVMSNSDNAPTRPLSAHTGSPDSPGGVPTIEHTPSAEATAICATSHPAGSTDSLALPSMLGDTRIHHLSRSGLDLSASVNSLLGHAEMRGIAGQHVQQIRSLGEISSEQAADHGPPEPAPRPRPNSLLGPRSATSTSSSQSLLSSRHASIPPLAAEVAQPPEVLDAIKRLFGSSDAANKPDSRTIVKGVEELEATLVQTLQTLRSLEAENKRLREELGQARA